MILQPLVENAILHGLHGLPRPGARSLSRRPANENSPSASTIRDNGFGMTI